MNYTHVIYSYNKACIFARPKVLDHCDNRGNSANHHPYLLHTYLAYNNFSAYMKEAAQRVDFLAQQPPHASLH